MYNFLKRSIDLLIALPSLLIISPFLLIIMVILKFTGEGEVFFKQVRLGYKNRPIALWKFVTMRKGSEKVSTITAKGDPRVLPVGKVLRKLKINELLQIVNVVTGEMSIVGPRPQTQECFDYFPDKTKPFIYENKPGLTGIGSLVFRDEEEIMSRSGKALNVCYQEDIMPYKAELELWYLKNKTVMVDLKIIILTAIAILFPKADLTAKWFKKLPGR